MQRTWMRLSSTLAVAALLATALAAPAAVAQTEENESSEREEANRREREEAEQREREEAERREAVEREEAERREREEAGRREAVERAEAERRRRREIERRIEREFRQVERANAQRRIEEELREVERAEAEQRKALERELGEVERHLREVERDLAEAPERERVEPAPGPELLERLRDRRRELHEMLEREGRRERRPREPERREDFGPPRGPDDPLELRPRREPGQPPPRVLRRRGERYSPFERRVGPRSPEDETIDHIARLRKEALQARREGDPGRYESLWREADRLEEELERGLAREPDAVERRVRPRAPAPPARRLEEIESELDRLRGEVGEIRRLLERALEGREEPESQESF